MEYTTTGGAAIAAALLVGLILSQPIYYCESKDIALNCDSLSSGKGTRCYQGETYKVCSEGWQRVIVSNDEPPDNEGPSNEVAIDGRDWRNDSGTCVFGSRKPINCEELINNGG